MPSLIISLLSLSLSNFTSSSSLPLKKCGLKRAIICPSQVNRKSEKTVPIPLTHMSKMTENTNGSISKLQVYEINERALQKYKNSNS
jgi:hypothetical protein